MVLEEPLDDDQPVAVEKWVEAMTKAMQQYSKSCQAETESSLLENPEIRHFDEWTEGFVDWLGQGIEDDERKPSESN